MSTTRRQFLRGSTATGLSASSTCLLNACSTEPPRGSPPDRPVDRPRSELGIASGHPQSSSVVLWTRLTGDDLPERVEVGWELAHDEAFQRVAARGVETAEAAWAHSVHAEPGGVEPGRWYGYRFHALGDRSTAGRTRTAPSIEAASGASSELRFAIASCKRYDSGHYAAWRDVATQNLDLVLFIGNYIYESESRPDSLRRHEGSAVRTLGAYPARFATYKRDPLLQAAQAASPWLVVWDDHEAQNDYAALQGPHLQVDFAEQRAAAYQAYWEHLPFPKSARPRLDVAGTEMRITGRLDWGTLARIHLSRSDERSCMLLTLDARRLEVALRVVDEVADPASTVRTNSSFVVEAARPGAVPA